MMLGLRTVFLMKHTCGKPTIGCGFAGFGPFIGASWSPNVSGFGGRLVLRTSRKTRAPRRARSRGKAHENEAWIRIGPFSSTATDRAKRSPRAAESEIRNERRADGGVEGALPLLRNHTSQGV